MIQLPVAILGTGSHLPGRLVTTAEVVGNLGKQGKEQHYETRTGIRTRWWAVPGTPITPLCVTAIKQALEAAGMGAKELRRVIVVYSGSGDLTFPATANFVAAELGLSGICDAFDLNNACMGFLSALDIAARAVATGMGPVALVAAELTSRAISTSDPRPYLVFGDAVAAAVIGPARGDEGIIASFLANEGHHPLDVYGDEPLVTGKLEAVQFARNSQDILSIAMDGLRKGLAGVLDRARARLDEIEWIVVHQPNGAMLDAIISTLQLDPARVVRVVDEIGSVASASIPFALDRLLRTRPVRPGDRILMTGVGGGVSYGGFLYRVGAR